MHQILGGTRTSYPPKNINVGNNICKTQGDKDKMIKPEDYSRTLEFLLSFCRDGFLKCDCGNTNCKDKVEITYGALYNKIINQMNILHAYILLSNHTTEISLAFMT